MTTNPIVGTGGAVRSEVVPVTPHRRHRAHRTTGLLAGIVMTALFTGVSAVGEDTQPDTDGVDIGYAKHGNVAVQTTDPKNGPANWRRLLNEIDTPLPSTESREITRSEQSDACLLDQRYLPHTADAVDGWYRNCRANN